VCADHAQTRPYILSAYKDGDVVKAIAVEGALFCGVCRPRDEPVDLGTD